MTWQTPKENWASPDCPTYTDLNRIEGNIAYLKAALDTLSGTVSTHTGDTTIHKTAAEIRADATLPIVIETRSSDPDSPAVGRLWLRTDL